MQDLYPNNDEWGEPLSLVGRALPSWPQNVFPDAMEDFVRELARFTETPIELSAMLAITAVATASHKKYQVQVKEGYCEPVNLWTIGILPPASRKSSVYKEIAAPLKEWERDQKAALEPLIRSAESNLKTQEARLKILRMQAAKASNDHDYAILQEKIEQLESALTAIPGYPRIWASDVTNEQLGVIMAANGDAMALLSDEGGIFDIITGLYSDGQSNIDLFLQAHAGSSFRVDRGSRPPIFMERAVLTMGLTVQPHVIKKITSNKTFRGRGLLGRFLYVLPKSNIGSRTLDEPPMSPECSARFRAIITAILNQLTPATDTIGIHTLQLDGEAYGKWLEFAKCIETLMGEDIGFLSHITDWAGKLPGAVARLAALLHIARYAHQHPHERKISLHDMSAAVKIGHTLLHHALAIFDLLQEDDAMQIARSIYHWIKEQNLEQFSLRDCKRKFRRLKDSVPAGLLVLEEAEIIRGWEKAPSVGRRSDMYSVNPKVLEK